MKKNDKRCKTCAILKALTGGMRNEISNKN